MTSVYYDHLLKKELKITERKLTSWSGKLSGNAQAAQAQFVLQIKNYKRLYRKATGLFKTVEILTISQ